MESRVGQSKTEHTIFLNIRENLSITGVKDIINFDESSVSIKTVCGELNIEGENIHINVLNVEKGQVEITGKINGINYFDTYDGDRKTLLSRIFR